MRKHYPVLTLALSLFATQACGWSNHTIPTYRALEKMPEVANANLVTVESLESFLKAEEKTIEVLLAAQEAWAIANLDHFPKRPAPLTFIANSGRTDDARRLAFLSALRVAPNSKLALFIQPDARLQNPVGNPMPFASVNTLPEPTNSGYKFIELKLGDQVAPLAVIATAADEPDYGLDINLWADSPSDWGKVYGFGALPFGNPALNYATQAPFHMGFFHEDKVLYMAAPFLKRTFPLLRSYQYWSLAALAFRTGHPYWGWRFSGMSLHYLQDLTQPYHSRLAPDNSTAKLLSINLLAMVGLTGLKDDMVVLLSNRHLAVEKYQNELLSNSAANNADSALDKALRNTERDKSYPEWSDSYVRNVVAKESSSYGAELAKTLVASLPEKYVSDPKFDFGVKEDGINLVSELAKRDAASRGRLEAGLAALLSNFGSHTRNAVRSILKASNQP
jgi:hypothetical protein